jgi:hypothetical protein
MRLGDLPFQAGINECLDPHIWRTVGENATVSLVEMHKRHGKTPGVFRLNYRNLNNLIL